MTNSTTRMTRTLTTFTTIALIAGATLLPAPSAAVMRGRGSVHHSGGPQRGGGNAAAFHAGQSSGRRQGAHAGYHAGARHGYSAGMHHGYHAGVHAGHWAHPWAFRAPTMWAWHPVGFLLTTLAVTAIVVAVVDDNGNDVSDGSVYYDQGVYYEKTSNGYKAIPPPQGAQISSLPEGYTSITVRDQSYAYYQGDFYTEVGGNYRVTTAPVGAVVPYVPDSGTKTTEGGTDYYAYNGVRYQAVSMGGETEYLVTVA